MAVNVSNIKPSPALRGQSAWVTLSAAESLSILPLLSLGLECTIESSTKVGYIDFIDLYGHSFRIKPAQLDKACDSDTEGLLKEDELITIDN